MGRCNLFKKGQNHNNNIIHIRDKNNSPFIKFFLSVCSYTYSLYKKNTLTGLIQPSYIALVQDIFEFRASSLKNNIAGTRTQKDFVL